MDMTVSRKEGGVGIRGGGSPASQVFRGSMDNEPLAEFKVALEARFKQGRRACAVHNTHVFGRSLFVEPVANIQATVATSEEHGGVALGILLTKLALVQPHLFDPFQNLICDPCLRSVTARNEFFALVFDIV